MDKGEAADQATLGHVLERIIQTVRDPTDKGCYSGASFGSAFTFQSRLKQTRSVKSLARFTLGILFLGYLLFPARAAFTSLYVFGDGACTTTNGPGASFYFEKSYSNGRVWVELLAQWQGLAYDSNKNWSYFGDYSSNLVDNLTRFSTPPDASTALFVVSVNNADFVFDMGYTPYTTNNIAAWTNAINLSLANHFKIITNLYYGKNARTLIMPNAVDITKIPQYNGRTPAEKSFVRQRVIDFNTAFTALLNNATSSLPGLTIYVPDIFALLDNVVAHAANYGLTNTLNSNGTSIGALGNSALSPWLLNGPGTNYIFWDPWHPTAKFHMVIADFIQQIISPAQFSGITSLNGSNRLDVANVPIGRNGSVEGTTNFTNWTFVQNIDTNNATQSIFVPVSDSLQFYRLCFPLVWTWP